MKTGMRMDLSGAVEPSKLEALSSEAISSVLGGVESRDDGFAFAVDKKDKTFVYYRIGGFDWTKRSWYGMDKTQFKDGCSIQIGRISIMLFSRTEKLLWLWQFGL